MSKKSASDSKNIKYGSKKINLEEVAKKLIEVPWGFQLKHGEEVYRISGYVTVRMPNRDHICKVRDLQLQELTGVWQIDAGEEVTYGISIALQKKSDLNCLIRKSAEEALSDMDLSTISLSELKEKIFNKTCVNEIDFKLLGYIAKIENEQVINFDKAPQCFILN